jgi:fatty acid omega-hydroxylase
MTPEEAFDAAMRYENRANPYPYFDELRKTPVVRVTNGVYAVTGYDELIALAHDPRVSSDRRKAPPPVTAGDRHVADESLTAMMDAYDRDPSFIASDPPEHDRARRQCMRFFGPPHSPDVIPSQEPLCRQIVNELLDKASEKAIGKTGMDVVDEFAYPLPVHVICRIIGVPIEDEPQFHPWIAEAITGLFDLGPDIATEEGQARQAKGQAANIAFKKYIIGLVEKAEKSSGLGMISQLVHDDGPDGRMSPSAIVNNTMLLFAAGHDSTVNLISHCVLTVLRNPESIELLRSRPELIPGAIEEVLRLQSSVQFFPTRSALADIEIAGTTIPRGSPVYLIYAAANRDPRRFPDPNTFDPQRTDNEHVGWGRGIQHRVRGISSPRGKPAAG